jgi:hypothetical protein
MTTMDAIALQWPALDLGGRQLPEQITYERGIWGKVHGASSDFRWIAHTPALTAPQRRLESELPLGNEDSPLEATLWRVLGETCYAVGIYPSQAQDAAGRRGFLEKQIVEWRRPPDVPAVLGALLLLPLAAPVAGTDWWEQRSDVRWSEYDYVMDLPASPSVTVSPDAIEKAMGAGLRALTQATTEEALAELYAKLLAGNRGVSLRGLTTPLPPAALAALLLPLPREMADTLSAAGWLPSSWLSASSLQEVQSGWDLVLGGMSATSTSGFIDPTPDQFRRGRDMAASVLQNVPPPPPIRVGTTKSVSLALWGPSAAGKTALLAELFLEGESDENWAVLPTGQSLEFIKTMRDRMRTNNLFPQATSFGYVEGIEYEFTHRRHQGSTALLHLEDRAGRESEEMLDDTTKGKVSLRQRLKSADGMVLVFDPLSDVAVLEARVAHTLEVLHVASGRVGRIDERPIAVCFSKADVLIKTPEDFYRARKWPDEFVREHMDSRLVRPLDRLCSNYRLFAVSAAGVRLCHGVVEPVVFIDENLEPRICPGGRPFNLMAPFSWVLNQLTGLS